MYKLIFDFHFYTFESSTEKIIISITTGLLIEPCKFTLISPNIIDSVI